jgi:Domain of unknown function (DUF4476)
VHTTITMKKMLQLALVLFISVAARAQQNYFVYVQTDNKQPFYIKMKDKIMSSSAAGYLVIPKLTTGTYAFTVGFPKDQWVQQSFNIAIGTNDAGYLLKNFGDKGWGLYNIQTMEISMNGSPASSTVKTTADNDDVFATTLSGVANTNLSVKKEVTPAPVKEEPIPVKEVVTKHVEKTTQSKIQKIQTFNDDDGKTIIYTDKSNNKIDTIRIFIPIENAPVVKEPAEVIKNVETVKTEPVKDKKFLDIDMQSSNVKVEEKKETVKKEMVVPPVVEPVIKTEKPVLTFNSDCKANATEEDFFKTRKKMVAEDTDDAMVDAAKKQFKQKCYSVEQIKNLSLLFLNDAGKYKFFDAAYPYTSDTQNFASLEALLKDEYYIKRFKSMIRN